VYYVWNRRLSVGVFRVKIAVLGAIKKKLFFDFKKSRKKFEKPSAHIIKKLLHLQAVKKISIS
jgi:hypothetical protein